MILYRAVAASILIAGAAAGSLSFRPQSETPTLSMPLAASEALSTPLPTFDPGQAKTFLARSPFAKERGPFVRNAPPPPPPLEIRLAGISRVAGKTRATLVIGAQTLNVGVGDATPAGPITAITADAVEIGGASPRRIELFKQ